MEAVHTGPGRGGWSFAWEIAGGSELEVSFKGGSGKDC